jgi:hypothetical protein
MRFNEFKIVLTENAAKFYTIGDSHAHAVGQMGGKDWANLAVGGASSKGSHPKIQQMLGNISQVTKGSVVLISLGANDTANAMVAGTKPSRTASSIAADVAGVVDKVRAQGPSKIVFLLFPNGPGRGSKDAKFYGGEFQDEVRAAIKSSLSGVEIIDLDGKPLPDGVHATMAVYKDVANQVKAKGGITLGPAGAKPGAPTTKDKQDPANNMKPGEDKMAHAAATQSLSVPTGNINPAVADIQKVLLALGYKLPKHGVDGARGPETRNAVKEFQRDNNLTVDGDPGPETIGAMNKLIATKKIAFVKSTPADVKGKFVNATDPQDVGDIMNSNDPAVASARKSAEKYLGREMSDEEWTALMKVTAAEEADTKAMAWVMAAILNRTNRGTWGNSVVSVVSAPYQFEPVTGASGKEQRLSSLPIPSGRKLNAILVGAKEILPSVPNKIVNFTSNIDAAYKGRASISYKDKLLAKGGEVVGNTIFAA